VCVCVCVHIYSIVRMSSDDTKESSLSGEIFLTQLHDYVTRHASDLMTEGVLHLTLTPSAVEYVRSKLMYVALVLCLSVWLSVYLSICLAVCLAACVVYAYTVYMRI
jgi:hypothetical protein